MTLKDAIILVVDDEPALRDIVGTWFRRVARDVVTAAEGAEALELLAARKIDLVVTDIRMPVMDGVTLLREARARGMNVPAVIFVSGFSDITARDAYDLGAEALIEKPFVRRDVIQTAERSLCDRAELWKAPPDPGSYPFLSRVFPNVAAAVRERRIAFGRGGFCIEAGLVAGEGPINFEIGFSEDRLTLSGQGIVRWVARAENLMGIELTSVNEEGRARAAELAAVSRSFIPRIPG